MIKSLRNYVLGRSGSGAASDYQLLVFTEGEAIERFPNAQYIENWRWDQAFYQSLLGDVTTCDTYAGFLRDGLSSGQVSLEGLPDWVQAHDQRLQVRFIDLNQRAYFQTNQLVEMMRPLQTSLFFWLYTTHWGARVFPLCEGRALQEMKSGQSFLTQEDVTGDGRPEVVIFDYVTQDPFYRMYIYDLSPVPPIPIPIQLPGSLNNVRWSVNHDPYRPRVEVEGSLDFGIRCPVSERDVFVWNGLEMVSQQATLNLDALTQQTDPTCAAQLFQTFLTRAARGDLGAVGPANQLIEAWPVACSPGVSQHPFSLHGCPTDVRDEARFRMALAMADGRDVNGARREMQAVVDRPNVTDSPWVEAARQFVRYYWASTELSRACRAAERCYPALGVTQMIQQTPIAYRSQLLDYLQKSGLPILNGGRFDLDQNGLDEHWLTVPNQDPLCAGDCPDELWVIVQSNRRFWAFRAGYISPDEPVVFQRQPSIDGAALFTFHGQGLPMEMALTRNLATGEPRIADVCSTLNFRMDEMEQDLRSGLNPNPIQRRLDAWGQVDFSTCRPPDAFLTQSRLQYLQGLAFELSGDAAQAVQFYQNLGQAYPGSIYAMMANSRLSGLQ